MTPREIRLGLLLAQTRALRASERGRDAEAAGWVALAELAAERLEAIAECDRLVKRERDSVAPTEWAGDTDFVPTLLNTRPALLWR